jgi:predicted DNA-binding WGR domain protein
MAKKKTKSAAKDDTEQSDDVAAKGSGQASRHTAVSMRYAGVSQIEQDGEVPRLNLYGNLNREPVYLDGVVKDPLSIREALAAVYAVVGSDFRYRPKDRTKYHAYRRMKNQTANLGAWQAQQAYFDWLAQNDPYAFCILDPVISVHPDKVFLEVFSKDEGTYANLAVDIDAFELSAEPVYGTTNIDFSQTLFDAIEQFRSYRETRLTIGQQAVEVATEGKEKVVEKKVNVPDSWIRGFLQVQSSANLPGSTFKLKPMDLYNVLRQLRMNKDVKGKRRSVRVELVPGEAPRLVMEPWDVVIEGSAGIYTGKESKVVRIWGRRRLMLLRRMLPLVEEIEVHVLGSGLPSFWVLRAGQMTFTFGLTGFNASNWSQSVNFDLMLPRSQPDEALLKKVIKHLSKNWSSDLEAIGKAIKLDGEELVEQLQRGCQEGQMMFDVANQHYRLRPLTNQPLEFEKYEFRNTNERAAHDLVLRQGAVKIVSENRIFGSGLELTGTAKVNEDKREYRPQLLISDEGFVSRAECTCSMFRQQGLKAGPCPHLIALRMAHAIRGKHRREGLADDDAISVETRTFGLRDGDRETVYQVTLDQKRLKVSWGESGRTPRVQQLQFPSVDDARQEYRRRLKVLNDKGNLDSTG